jgi:threonine/homoserine/homoserine lactone efflux protein
VTALRREVWRSVLGRAAILVMIVPLIPLIGFAVAASITPGPNNVMVAASAANHGLRATVPGMLGITVGFTVMLAVVGLGIAGVLAALPTLALALRLVCMAWLLVLAWRIANAGAPGSGPRRPPLGFLGAALFQWANPKAWMLAIGAAGTFIQAGHPLGPQVALIAGTFCVVCLPCVSTWAALGSMARRLLHSPTRLRAFNVGMAALMVLSMLPLAFE